MLPRMKAILISVKENLIFIETFDIKHVHLHETNSCKIENCYSVNLARDKTIATSMKGPAISLSLISVHKKR